MRSLHSHRTKGRRRFCSSESSGSQPSASFQASSQILAAGVGLLGQCRECFVQASGEFLSGRVVVTEQKNLFAFLDDLF